MFHNLEAITTAWSFWASHLSGPKRRKESDYVGGDN